MLSINLQKSRVGSGWLVAVVLAGILGLTPLAWAASPVGDVVGKITVGYQGWFACPGDGAPIGQWWHYSGGNLPTPNTLSNSLHCWPDMRQFTHVYQTGFTNFGNGQPATLFSSYDDQTVQTHFRWMAENNLDTAALQRFDPFGGEGPTRDDMAVKVRTAAETYNRKFYIMYDITGWNNFATELANDWTNKIIGILHLTNSPSYATQNGKPVICIWGMGFTDRPGDATTCSNVITWFQNQGVYVIGGVPTHWLAQNSDSKSNFLSAYSVFNMISPWMVGRFGTIGGFDGIYNGVNIADYNYCSNHGIDYQPCVLPGDNGARSHGDLMWHEFYQFTKLKVQGIYISMFDEFNEGNQIACTAENAGMVPVGATNLYFSLDQDGTPCSADYYLRLTGDGGRMLKGQIALTTTRPTVPKFPLIIPPAPTGVTALSGNGKVTLAWNPVAGAADATSYNIWRTTSPNGPFILWATNIGHVSFTDTGLANNEGYYYQVTAVNGLAAGTNSTAVSAMPTVFYQVNSGGGAAGVFTADAGFSAGSTSTTSAPIDRSAVTNPAPQAVYQSDRWGANTYSFTSLYPSTTYRVRLHFAEIFYGAAAKRQFNVKINGNQVLTNYDIFVDAGTSNKATIKEYTVNASSSGQIAVQYINVLDNAKSSGIEVLPFPGMPTNVVATAGDGSVALSWLSPSASVTSYNVKRATTVGGPYATITNVAALAYTDGGLSNGTSYYYAISAINSWSVEGSNSVPVSAQAGASAPQLSAALNGGQLQIAWPVSYIGWHLQSQTNGLAAPNWSSIPGSETTNVIQVPVNSAINVFYRLINQ